MTRAESDVVHAFEKWESAKRTQPRVVIGERLAELRAAIVRLREEPS